MSIHQIRIGVHLFQCQFVNLTDKANQWHSLSAVKNAIQMHKYAVNALLYLLIATFSLGQAAQTAPASYSHELLTIHNLLILPVLSSCVWTG